MQVQQALIGAGKLLNQAVQDVNTFIQRRTVTALYDLNETFDVEFGGIDDLAHSLAQCGWDLALRFVDTQVAAQADIQRLEFDKRERGQ